MNIKKVRSDYQWEKGYQETVKYKKKHGVANCKNIHVTEDGYPLGEWQSAQRKNYKKGAYMTKDRIDKLNKIEFVWE